MPARDADSPALTIDILASPGSSLPRYMSPGAAGADLCACLGEPLIIPPGVRHAVPTGLRMAIPAGYEGQIRPRSGLALSKGITCLNTPGTIDSDYRGEIKVILINHGTEDFMIRPGDRIAQIVFAPCIQAGFVPVADLPLTERGEGGFGWTKI